MKGFWFGVLIGLAVTPAIAFTWVKTGYVINDSSVAFYEQTEHAGKFALYRNDADLYVGIDGQFACLPIRELGLKPK